jgi:serine/threonine-protein kinase
MLYQGDTIGRYTIVAYLASGGYGTVYKARCRDSEQLVALKMVELEHGDEACHDRFIQEMEILKSLQHPHIVKIYECHGGDRPPWYSMEFLAGPPLNKAMAEDWPLYRKVTVLKQIAAALGTMHEHGIIHRDVKPHNIMFRDNDCLSPVLFDMGLVHNPCRNLTRYHLLGTLNYLSPEQMDRRYDYKQIDVWALGIILYQWLTHTHPLADQNMAALLYGEEKKAIPAVCDICPQSDPYLSAVCSRALELNTERRYANGRDMENALSQWERVRHQEQVAASEQAERQGDITTAIACLEQAYLWYPAGSLVNELTRLWQKKCSDGVTLVLAEQFTAMTQQAQSRGAAVTVLTERHAENQDIRPEEIHYMVCKVN